LLKLTKNSQEEPEEKENEENYRSKMFSTDYSEEPSEINSKSEKNEFVRPTKNPNAKPTKV